MTGLEILGLVALYTLILVIPIGTYLGLGGEATDVNSLTKFIETPNAETDI